MHEAEGGFAPGAVTFWKQIQNERHWDSQCVVSGSQSHTEASAVQFRPESVRSVRPGSLPHLCRVRTSGPTPGLRPLWSRTVESSGHCRSQTLSPTSTKKRMKEKSQQQTLYEHFLVQNIDEYSDFNGFLGYGMNTVPPTVNGIKVYVLPWGWCR